MLILNIIWTLIGLVLALGLIAVGQRSSNQPKAAADAGGGSIAFGLVVSWATLASAYPFYRPLIPWLNSSLPQSHTAIHYFTLGIVLVAAFVVYELILVLLGTVMAKLFTAKSK